MRSLPAGGKKMVRQVTAKTLASVMGRQPNWIMVFRPLASLQPAWGRWDGWVTRPLLTRSSCHRVLFLPSLRLKSYHRLVPEQSPHSTSSRSTLGKTPHVTHVGVRKSFLRHTATFFLFASPGNPMSPFVLAPRLVCCCCCCCMEQAGVQYPK